MPEMGENQREAVSAEHDRAVRLGVPLSAGATFLFWASLYTYVPILPVYTQALGASMAMVGAVVSAYGITQLVLRIPIGLLADFLGRRKPFAVAGLLFSALGALGLAYSPNPWLLFSARALTGVAAATWVAFSVLFASYYSRERATRAMGIIAFVNNSAIVSAGLVGGLIAQEWGWRAAFLSGLALAMPGFIGLLFAPELPRPKGSAFFWRELAKVGTTPLLLHVSLIGILTHFVSFGTSLTFVPVYADGLGASKAELGLLATLLFGFSTLGNLGVVFVSQRWGVRHTIYLGSALVAVSTLAIPFIHSMGMLYITQAVSGLGRGLVSPVLLALAIRAVPLSGQATAMGFYQALYSIGMLTGPLISGVLADSWGIGSVFYLSAAVSFLAGGLAYVRVIPLRS